MRITSVLHLDHYSAHAHHTFSIQLDRYCAMHITRVLYSILYTSTETHEQYVKKNNCFFLSSEDPKWDGTFSPPSVSEHLEPTRRNYIRTPPHTSSSTQIRDSSTQMSTKRDSSAQISATRDSSTLISTERDCSTNISSKRDSSTWISTKRDSSAQNIY